MSSAVLASEPAAAPEPEAAAPELVASAPEPPTPSASLATGLSKAARIAADAAQSGLATVSDALTRALGGDNAASHQATTRALRRGPP